MPVQSCMCQNTIYEHSLSSAGVMNDAYTSGINCPYEIPDQWKYLFIAEWYVDPTLRFSCTKTRQQWEGEQRKL